MALAYLEELDKGMRLIADDPRTLIVGQAVSYKGHCLTRQAAFWDEARRIEMPVAEEFQTGFALGLALDGNIPVSVYPRHNFLLCAMSQLVNHIDKWDEMGGGNPHMILVAVKGSDFPLDPGSQHKAGFSHEFASMCKNINVTDIMYPHQAVPTFERAIKEEGVHLITTHGDLM